MSGSIKQSQLKYAAKLAVLALAYFLSAKLGLLLATIHSSVSPVWPATGIAIAALAVMGRDFWPAIWLGALFANLLTKSPVLSAFLIATGNTIEAVAGAWILERATKFERQLETMTETAAVTLSSLVAPVFSASIGVATLVGLGTIPFSGAAPIWFTWWIGDALGALILSPWLIELARGPRFSFQRFAEVALISVISMGSVWLVFTRPSGSDLLFTLFPVVLAGTWAFGAWGGKTAALVLCASGVGLTLQGAGPFIGGSLNENLIHLQLFMAAIGLSALMFGAFRKSGPLKFPAAFLLTGWLLGAILLHSFHVQEDARDSAHLKEIAGDMEDAIRTRMTLYEDALRGAVGLYHASHVVEPSEWGEYVRSLRIDERYSGINGIGVVWRVDTSKLSSFLSASKKDDPTFSIHSIPGGSVEDAGKRYGNHYVIRFVEPAAKNLFAVGFDIGSEATRRRGAELAMDTGEPTVTDPLRLIQASERLGFLLFMPLYQTKKPVETVEQRRHALLGWIYAPFITEQFFSGILRKESKEAELSVFHGDSIQQERFLYSSIQDSDKLSGFEFVKTITLGQQHFTLAWKRARGFVSAHGTASAWVGFCVAIVNLLLTGLFVLLQSIGRQANRIAKEKTSVLQSLINSSPVPILALNEKREVTLWNPACEKMFGWREEEVLGNFLPFVPADKIVESRRYVELIYSTQQAVYFEADRVKKDGTVIRVEAAGMPLIDEQGKVYGLMAVLSDITEKSRINAELRKANEAFRLATEAKSNFLATVSHEIRTPINGVIGMTGMLLDTILSASQREYTETIRDSADTLLTLINDILDFSKIEAERLQLENIEFDLTDVVENVERTTSLIASRKGLLFGAKVLSQKGSRTFRGDPTRLGQVLLNLVSNAIKFTAKGSIDILVSEEERTDTHAVLRFEVRDTGIGIPASMLNKMFKPFTQADASTTRRYGGTGLGLSICKRLVGLMGGEIGVQSVEGHGSVFWFTVKVAVVEKSQHPQSSSESKIEQMASLRILLAEDNAVNQKIAIAMLRKHGHRVDAVANGREALESLRLVSYDLILMDCQMPELDGYAATREIRNDPSLNCSNIPIIALTANAMEGDREKCLEAGMTDYVSKPIKESNLIETIQKVMKRVKVA